MGVLVRVTTCKRLTNSLPKLSLITIGARFDRSISIEVPSGQKASRSSVEIIGLFGFAATELNPILIEIRFGPSTRIVL